MFKLKKSDTQLSTENIKKDKDFKEKQENYTQKLTTMLGQNFKPNEQIGFKDSKIFKSFSKIYKVIATLGLAYTLNSEYNMGELLSLTSFFAVFFTLASYVLIDFLGTLKYYMLKADQTFLLIIPVIFFMLFCFFPTKANMTSDVLYSTFHSTQNNQKLISLLELNSLAHPENAEINQTIIENEKNNNSLPTYDLMTKQYSLTSYKYSLDKNYQKNYKKYKNETVN